VRRRICFHVYLAERRSVTVAVLLACLAVFVQLLVYCRYVRHYVTGFERSVEIYLFTIAFSCVKDNDK
jgi:hypothetical protein